MDWRREIITKWLWHAFNGFEESERQNKTGPSSGYGYIDQAQLRLLTAHIGHALGSASNSGSINGELEKHFKEKEGHVNFKGYLEFLHTHTYLEPKDIDLKKLEESCWSLCQKTYEKRVSKFLDLNQVRRVWKLFNFYSEADEYPIIMCRDETQILMEKLVVGTGNRWQTETFEYKTQGIEAFQFLQVLACFETNYAKGMDMDRTCVMDSVENLYDEIIEQCEKKGWITKKGNKVMGPKERWFVLKKSGMYYYTDKSESPKTLKGCIELDKDWSIESQPDAPKHKNGFMLSKKVQVGKEKIKYDLSCDDPKSRAEWIAAVKAVINSESQDSIHRTQMQERRQKRKEAKNKEQTEIEKRNEDNINQIKLQKLEKEKDEALAKLRAEEEERRRREEEEKKMREQERQEKERIEAEIKRLQDARDQAEQQAQDEAAKRLARELEEHERQLMEQKEREEQQRELDDLKLELEEEKRHREQEARHVAELQIEKQNLEILLAEEKRAKILEEEIRVKQASLLKEEEERRKALELLKEEQEKELAREKEQRKGLERESEELARIQKEQVAQLRKEQERLQKLADERKRTDAQLKEAKLKLAEAENRRVEQETEKKRREEEIARKKKERSDELTARTKQRLGTTVQLQSTKVLTHRGEGAFTESEFEVLKQKIKAKETKLRASRRKTQLFNMSRRESAQDGDDQQNGQTNGVKVATEAPIPE